MFCTACGNQVSPGMDECPNCGAQVVMPSATVETPGIRNYLLPAIFVTFCCCMPFGIVAIVFAAQVSTKVAAGDLAGAQAAANNAKLWSWIGFGCGLGGAILYGLFFGLPALHHH